MSPFTQLNSGLNRLGYGGGVDRDFSPILNYVDEFDRHFSHRHRFLNCFIPRFDLEEDAHAFYLYGDIPGARVEDINIEARDNHTLVIEGKTQQAGPPRPAVGERGIVQHMPMHSAPPQGSSPGEGEDPFVRVDVDDHEHESEHAATAPKIEHTEFTPPPPEPNPDAITQAPPAHPHHTRHTTTQTFPPPPHPNQNQERRVLLSERLTGDFHRTFAFPSAVQEEGVKASMENGVLCVVVPKKEGRQLKKGRRVPVVHGNWWKGDERGSGFGFASGAV